MGFQPVGVQLVLVQTSPNDRLLWVLDNRGGVHVRTGLSHQMPVGTNWEPVPGRSRGYWGHSLTGVMVKGQWSDCVCLSGLAVSHLVLSSRTVWVRCPNGEIARRYGVSERNPAGDYWKKIPGTAHWLTGETGRATGPSVTQSASPVHHCVSLVCLSVHLSCLTHLFQRRPTTTYGQ